MRSSPSGRQPEKRLHSSLIEQANKHHQTIKFTAKVFETETKFLDITVYKGERFKTESMLDIRTHFKPTETF